MNCVKKSRIPTSINTRVLGELIPERKFQLLKQGATSPGVYSSICLHNTATRRVCFGVLPVLETDTKTAIIGSRVALNGMEGDHSFRFGFWIYVISIYVIGWNPGKYMWWDPNICDLGPKNICDQINLPSRKYMWSQYIWSTKILKNICDITYITCMIYVIRMLWRGSNNSDVLPAG